MSEFKFNCQGSNVLLNLILRFTLLTSVHFVYNSYGTAARFFWLLSEWTACFYGGFFSRSVVRIIAYFGSVRIAALLGVLVYVIVLRAVNKRR